MRRAQGGATANPHGKFSRMIATSWEAAMFTECLAFDVSHPTIEVRSRFLYPYFVKPPRQEKLEIKNPTEERK
jgi:hypothetical protein